MHQNEFDKDNGSKQELLFGKCEKHIPGGAPLLQPSTKPSHVCEKYTCEEWTLACDKITNDVDLSPSAKDLLVHLLDVNPHTRYTAEQAMGHCEFLSFIEI